MGLIGDLPQTIKLASWTRSRIHPLRPWLHDAGSWIADRVRNDSRLV